MKKINTKKIRLQFKNIRNKSDVDFVRGYRSLILADMPSTESIDAMIEFIAFLMVAGDEHLIKMAYYLSIQLGIVTKDFTILRDISNRLGYYPVVSLIDRITDRAYVDDDKIDDLLSEALALTFKGTYYRTEEQYYFDRQVSDFNDVVAVAPTSYGKSQLMIKKCIKKYKDNKKVCIVIPTKSLLAQTVSEITKLGVNRKDIITHPDMMTDQVELRPHIGVLTQERLMSILIKHDNIAYDYLFIDEAHNLLNDEPRDLLLARDIIILNTRKSVTHIDYYSPFVASPETSLNMINFNNEPVVSLINEFVKVPQYFLWNEKNGVLSVYDQFTNEFFESKKIEDDLYTTTINLSGKKNIIYANKPRDIETIADILAEKINEIEFCEESQIIISRACSSISEIIHDSYNQIRLLKRGIVISHGKMTDVVRNYVEYLFKIVPELKYIITTSTLLEGVNIPAERIFLYDYMRGRSRLSPSSFHNLVGRICRFRDIFGEENTEIGALIPRIYLMQNNKYMRSNANLKNFIKGVARDDIKQKDDISNPLLDGYKKKDKIERRFRESVVLGNIDNRNASSYEEIGGKGLVLAQTDFGKACYEHGVDFFDVFYYESVIAHNLQDISIINNVKELMDVISKCILEPTYDIQSKQWIYMLFSSDGTCRKITSILQERASGDFNFAKLIAFDIDKWRKAIRKNGSCLAYVGAMGDRGTNIRNSKFKHYHLFNQQDDTLMASYAVSLEKENLDNIDYNIMPIIETLHDLKKVDDDLFKCLKYGTDNDFVIKMIQLGIDLSLANKIAEEEELRSMFEDDEDSIICKDKEALLTKMRKNNMPAIYIKLAEDLL